MSQKPVFEEVYHVPKRPKQLPSGEDLYYRTHPSQTYLSRHLRLEEEGISSKQLRICSPLHVEGCLLLYNFFNSLDAVAEFRLKDLSEYIGISSKVAGQIVLEAIAYDPRKNVSHGGTSTYRFRCRYVQEIVYGIEWQICSFLPNFKINTKEDVEIELEQWANYERRELISAMKFYTQDEFGQPLKKEQSTPNWPKMSYWPELKIPFTKIKSAFLQDQSFSVT